MLRSLSEDWSSLRMLIEINKDVNTYSLEKLYGTLMTYSSIVQRQRRKRGKAKKKQMIAIRASTNMIFFFFFEFDEVKTDIDLLSVELPKLIIDEGTTSENMSDEEFDDLDFQVKKWRNFRNNQLPQKKVENGEEKKAKNSFATIMTNQVTRESSFQTIKNLTRGKHSKQH